jgi:acyl-CoA thioester hydrolase
MAISESVDIKVEFYDVDPMNVVWHGNYTRFFERARSALLERIGFSYVEMKDAGYAFPVVDLRVKFIRPIQFGQTIRVEAILVEWENRLRIDYRIVEPETGLVATKAQTTQFAVDMRTNETCLSCPGLHEKVAKWL